MTGELLLIVIFFCFVVAGNDAVLAGLGALKFLVAGEALADQFWIAGPDNDIVWCIDINQ
ncbi:hypothetical protein D3C80_2228060 [compost metagenome]